MAATGATPLQLYYSGTPGSTPSIANLRVGELAINYADGILFYYNGTSIKQFTPPTLAAIGGTINGVTIGVTTPSTGSFTTLVASGTVSGVGITSLFAAPPAIGGTTAALITGTTITANTQFSGAGTGLTGTAASLTAGNATTAATATTATTATTALAVTGVTNGGNASAGQVGEYVTAGTNSGSGAFTFTVSNTAYTIKTLSLSAGDWDVWGDFSYSCSTTSSVSSYSFTITNNSNSTQSFVQNIGNGGTNYLPQVSDGAMPFQRINSATAITVTLSGAVTFSSGTTSSPVYNIYARRAR